MSLPVNTVHVKYLGLQDYEPVWRAMSEFTDTRTAQTPDEIWVVEHKPVFTQGQAGKAEHVLNPGDIPVIKTDRGGQVTYHGPGQLVVYPLLNLRRLNIGVRELVTRIENSVVTFLKKFDIEAAPKADAPGVYVEGNKIASLGLRIRKGNSFHGVSININMDTEPFLRINPCGYAALKMVQLKEFIDAKNITVDDVASQYVACLAQQLELNSLSA